MSSTAPLDAPAPSSEDLARPRAAERKAVTPRFRARKKRPTALIVAGVVALAGVCTAAYLKFRPVPVTTTPIVRGTAIEAAYATGTVEPYDRVIVKAKVSGAVDLKVKEGMHVNKGDVVAVIDSPTLAHDLEKGKADEWAAEAQASGPQLAALRAQAESIQADLHMAQSDKDAEERLVASGAKPQIELDHLRDKIRVLEGQLQSNVALQRSLSIDLSARKSASSAIVGSLAARLADTEVRSPLDGVVLTRNVEPGEVAQVNTPLMKIGTADNLILECWIDEADVGRVAVGQKVAISLYGYKDTTFKGEIYEVLPDADRAKKSFLSRVRFIDPPKDKPLKSGMTADSVNVIIHERPNSLLLPAEAVDAAGKVLVVSGGHVQARTPKLGVRDMLRIEVLDGLTDGDEVVVAGGDGLADGARVRATERPPADGMKAGKGASSALTL